MSKEKEKSFWEDIKDSTKKYFTSSKKKPKKPGAEQKAVSSASGGATRVVAGSSGESKNGLHSQGPARGGVSSGASGGDVASWGGSTGASKQGHREQGPMHDQSEQRVAKTDVKAERLEQEVKRQRNKDVNTGASTVKSFDVETCRSKLVEHYKRTAKVPTSVWSSVCQVELDQIYTGLSWVKKEQTPAGPSQSELRHYTDLFTANKNGVIPKRILVQGQTGVGKSTFVKKLTVDWAKCHGQNTVDDQFAAFNKLQDNEKNESQADALRKFDLVVAINLKEVSRCQTLNEVFNRSRLFPKDDKTSTDDLLSYVRNNQERVLLVFDGYDEYRSGSEAEAQFGSRSDSPICNIFYGSILRDCTVLVTTRPSRADELEDSADKRAEITGFNSQDQKAFMKKMLDSETQVRDVQRFLSKNNLSDLARVPLLTLFFCLLWKQVKEQLMELIKTKTKLYKAMIRHILRYSHKKFSPTQVSKVKEENYEEMLAEMGKVALEALLKGNHVFEFGQLSDKVRGEESLIVGLLQLSEYEEPSLEPMEVVSFIHKSIQEYLAAWYITYKCVPEGNLGGIEEHVFTLEGCMALENVFPFVCGLSKDGAVKVFKHLTTVRNSDPSLDLSKMIPDEENETDVPLCDVTDRQRKFNSLVLNCIKDVSTESELVKHWYDCTGGIVVNRPLSELLPKVDVLHEEAHCWTFVFERPYSGQNVVVSLNESVKFLDFLHIPLRITESSREIKLGDFLANFLNVKCNSVCNFSSILCCRDGRTQFYITGLSLWCDDHARVFTEAAATICVVSPPINLCSKQPCLKFLTSVFLDDIMDGDLIKDLGGMIKDCKHLKEICLSLIDYACDFLGQIPNPGPCDLKIECILTSAGAVKLAGFLPMFDNITRLNLHLTECSAEAVTTLVLSITHKTLKELELSEISLTAAAAAALGRVLPEMLSLKRLELDGVRASILKAEEMMALFGGFNKTLPLNTLIVSSFRVRGSLAPLIKSIRYFPSLTILYLIDLDMDERDLCGLLESFRFIRNLQCLNLNDNQLGHAVTSIVPHITNLPELVILNLTETGCSEEDKRYVREAVNQVLPRCVVWF